MKSLLILCMLLCTQTLYSQSINLFDIDTTNFPTMKAKFFAFDAQRKQQYPNIGDMTLKENGELCTITNITCPPQKQRVLSVCIMVDTYKYIDIARLGTQRLIGFLDMPQEDEVAVTYMEGRAAIWQDFTKDKDKALAKAQSIPLAPGVDVNTMFYSDYTGGIPMIKDRSSEKKVLILVSDLHCPNLNIDESKVIADAKKYNISIYTVLLGTTDYTKLFSRIAAGTSGQVFENVKDAQQIENIFDKIAIRENNQPCDIEWQAQPACTPDKAIELAWQSQQSLNQYTVSLSQVSSLHASPSFIRFGKRIPNISYDTTITLTANNADFTVTGVNRKNGSSDLTIVNTNFPFTILKDESRTLILRFSPSDSSIKYANFVIETDKCPAYFSANGGFPGKKAKLSTLKLTHPNGGETFVAGSDTVITWEGISPSDTVSLDYSIDNGKSWRIITNKASGLQYHWKNVPLPPSTTCLMRIKQSENGGSTGVNGVSTIEWQKCLGGTFRDQAESIHQTFDGGYIVAGYTSSFDGDVSGSNGGGDYWVVKLDSSGIIQWQKCLGGGGNDVAKSILQTFDGGYIVAGYTSSNDGDVSGNHGSIDYWVVKLDASGKIDWQKCLGGIYRDYAESIQQTSDGGYIVAGYTESKDGDVVGHHGGDGYDYWIVKLDGNGKIEWQKCLGGTNGDVAFSIQQTIDGGYIVAGSIISTDGDVSGHHGAVDYWVVKLDGSGKIEWQKCLGGTRDDRAYSIQQTLNGGYIVTGTSHSNDGDVSGNIGFDDYWVVKLDSSGKIEWQKCLGGTIEDRAESIHQTFDGGYIVAGKTVSNDGDVIGNLGFDDYWVVKLDVSSTILWQKCLGGSDYDWANSIHQTFDGGYIVAGYTHSRDGDVSGNHGSSDYWVVKLSPDGTLLQEDQSDAVFSIIAPVAVLEKRNIDMGKVLVGSSKDTMVTAVLCNKGDAVLYVLGVDVTNGDKSEFIVPRGAGEFYLEPNTPDNCRAMMFAFMPNRVGKRTAQITIRTTIGDFIDSIEITGEGIQPQLAIAEKFIDFGKVGVGDSKDSLQCATIQNIGTVPITIIRTSYGLPNDKDFSTITGNTSFVLNPGAPQLMDLRFSPSDSGRTSGTLEFHYNGLGSPAIIQLFGEGITVSPRGTIKTNTISGYAGEEIEIPIQLISQENIAQSGITSIDMELSFNPTLLSPIGYSIEIINDTLGKISMKNIPIIAQNGKILHTVRCIVGLGNAEQCVLDLSNLILHGGTANINIVNGKFTLLGICEEGGTRLINPGKATSLMRIHPNPSKGIMSVDLELIEQGLTKVRIIDMQGNVMVERELIDAIGSITVIFDMEKYGAGVYYIEVRTPTIVRKEKIMIEK